MIQQIRVLLRFFSIFGTVLATMFFMIWLVSGGYPLAWIITVSSVIVAISNLTGLFVLEITK